MIELVAAAGFVLTILVACSVIAAAFALLFTAVKFVLWVVFWPLRLLFGLLVAFIVLPIVAVTLLLTFGALVIVGVALLVIPLFPILLIALLVWLLTRPPRSTVPARI